MNFQNIFIFVALILAVFAGQSQAGWLKKVGKKIVSSTIKNSLFFFFNIYFKFLLFLMLKERVGQHTRDATIQGLSIAQQAANVAATARG